MTNIKKVAVIMGSDSDLRVVSKTATKLKELGAKFNIYILSAHKTLKETISFSENAAKEGYGVIIAAAGMAAHLAGIVAANTVLPVIGLPINCSLNGLDALFSTVQMPKGVPVLTVGIDAAENAAIAACKILALENVTIREKLIEMKKTIEEETIKKNENLKF